MRRLHYRPQVQLLSKRADRASRSRYWRFFPEVWIELFKLANLPCGSPTEITMPGVSHVRMGDRFKTTRRVESRGQFGGERLIMGKVVGLGRADGLFVEAFGIEFAAFNACNLRTNQRCAVREILRTIFCPYFQLSVVRGQSLEMLLSLVGRCGVPGCGAGQRAVKVIFRGFKTGWGCPKQPLRPQGGIDGRSIVPGKEARLQLAGPIPTFGQRQSRVTGQMALEPQLIKLPIGKGTKFLRQATETSDQPELRGNAVDDETEPHLMGKLEAMLGFALHLNERIARREQVRVQVHAAVRRKCEIADLVRGLGRLTQRIAASLDMFRPRHNKISKAHIGPGLEAPQAAFFDQFIAKPTESKSGLVVVEMWAGYHAKPYIGEARTVAVAILDAEVNRPADSQGKKVRIRKQCRWQDLGQHIQGRERRRVAHQRQLNELLNRTAPEL